MVYQQNQEKIASLTQQSTSLDSKLDALLSTLASARNQLLSIPGIPEFSITQVIDGEPSSPDDCNDETQVKKVQYSDLLIYATRISKFSTAPVGLIKLSAQPQPAAPVTTAAAAAAAAAATAENVAPESTSNQPQKEKQQQPPAAAPVEQATVALADAIRDAATAKQMGVQIWFPWPVEDQMRRSVLFMSEPDS